MSKLFEEFANETATQITKFVFQHQTDATKMDYEMSIRALTHLTCESDKLYDEAANLIDTPHIGMALASLLDGYDTIRNIETISKREQDALKMVIYLLQNPDSVEFMTVPELEIPETYKVSSAAAEQMNEEVIQEEEKEEEKPEEEQVAIDTGTMIKSEETIDDVKPIELAPIPDGYEPFNAKPFGLKHKYCYIRHISDSDRRAGLYDRTARRYMNAHTFSNGGYGFEVKEDDNIFFIDQPSLERILESCNRGYGLMKEQETIIEQPKQEQEEELKSVDIDWFVDQDIPADKYVLYSNGEVYDKVHHKYVIPQSYEKKNGEERVTYRLTSGRMPIGPHKKKVKAEKVIVTRAELMEHAGF